MSNMNEQQLSEPQFAVAVGMPLHLIRRWRREGKLTHTRRGAQAYYDVESVRDFVWDFYQRDYKLPAWVVPYLKGEISKSAVKPIVQRTRATQHLSKFERR
jgi:hypothetical protein